MQGFNHIAGGLVFTGLFASFHDVNIFEKPEYIIFTIGAAILPDIDHTKSIIGKMAFPLAKWLSLKYGHRTITHSLVFLIGCLIITKFVEYLYLKNTNTFSIIIGYALLSHLVFDMVTRTGIPFFWPFSSRPCVLPDNPSMRLRSNDLRSEAVVFVIFNGLLLFCWPLFEKGFWQKYNETFMTYDHIRREAKRKNDMLNITFLDANKDTIKGMLIEYRDADFITYTNEQFQHHHNKDCHFISFSHTNKPYKTKQLQIFNVTIDSLKTYLKLPLINLEVQSNTELFFYDGAVLQSSKTISKKYIQNFDFFVKEQDHSESINEIKAIEARIGEEQRRYNREVNLLRTEVTLVESELKEGNKNYYKLSDYQKGNWIRHRPELEDKISRLQNQLRNIPLPNTEADKIRLEILKHKLKSEKVELNANLEILI